MAPTPGYGGVLSQGVRGAIKEIWFAVVGLPDAVPLVHLIGLPVVLQLRLCGCRTHSPQKPDQRLALCAGVIPRGEEKDIASKDLKKQRHCGMNAG